MALGVPIAISFLEQTPSTVRQAVNKAWTDALAPEGTKPLASVTVPVQDQDQALQNLSTLVTYKALRYHRGEQQLFHAAGLAHSDGRVVAFVGRSGAGKTTLSQQLGQFYGYVSDETIAVGEDLTIQPYRKPLSIVRPGQPKEQIAPSTLGLKDLPAAPLVLNKLILLQREPDRVDYKIEPVPLVEALQGLLQQMSFTQAFPHPVRGLAHLGEKLGGYLRLRYGNDTDLAPAFEEILSWPTLVPEPWHSLPPQHPTNQHKYRLDNVIDALVTNREMVVFSNDSTVRILDGIGPAVYQCLHKGYSLQATVSEVVGKYGPPPGEDPTELVTSVVEAFTAAKLISPVQQ